MSRQIRTAREARARRRRDGCWPVRCACPSAAAHWDSENPWTQQSWIYEPELHSEDPCSRAQISMTSGPATTRPTYGCQKSATTCDLQLRGQAAKRPRRRWAQSPRRSLCTRKFTQDGVRCPPTGSVELLGSAIAYRGARADHEGRQHLFSYRESRQKARNHRQNSPGVSRRHHPAADPASVRNHAT
jgi:hypothetical protein